MGISSLSCKVHMHVDKSINIGQFVPSCAPAETHKPHNLYLLFAHMACVLVKECCLYDIVVRKGLLILYGNV